MPRLREYWKAKANALMTDEQRKATDERYAEWQHHRDMNNRARWNAACVARARQWSLEHPEEAKERRRKSAAARKARRMEDPEYAAKHAETKRKRRASPSYKRNKRATSLRSKGWTPERYDATLKEQGNCCAICSTAFVDTPSADHKHVEPPVPRGLLCGKCNTGIGFLGDSPERLEAAAQYLRKFS